MRIDVRGRALASLVKIEPGGDHLVVHNFHEIVGKKVIVDVRALGVDCELVVAAGVEKVLLDDRSDLRK